MLGIAGQTMAAGRVKGPILAVTLTIAVIAALAAGCGKNTPPGSADVAKAACDTTKIIRIGTFEELCKIGKDPEYPLCGRYELTADIDAAESRGMDGGMGFEPIGSINKGSGLYHGGIDEAKELAFSGSFDGKGFLIQNLYINRPNLSHVGLFGTVSQGDIKNVGVIVDTVVGNDYVGGLAGYSIYSDITKCYVSGKIVGRGENVGGLVGSMNINLVTNCHAMGSVTGKNNVGGLVGWNVGTITNCYSTAKVKATAKDGNADGLTFNGQGNVINSYWNIETSGVADKSNIDNDGGDMLGIRGCDYNSSAGYVFCGEGFTGTRDEDCDICKDGPASYYSCRGRGTAEMTLRAIYEGWDFGAVWQISAGKSYPYLKDVNYPPKLVTAANPKHAAGMLQAVASIAENMILVEGGAFMMGCTEEQGKNCFSNEKPARSVTVKSFHIGKYTVTRKQWNQIMYHNPPDIKDGDLPVASISGYEANRFISRLNAFSGKKYRLLTEAEWEYAARGGANSKGYKYAGSDDIDEVAWYGSGRIAFKDCGEHYWEDDGGTLRPVGTKAPNELGIYDMSGNVFEMTDGAVRGGAFFASAEHSRVSSSCSITSSDHRVSGVGLRLAMSP